MPRIISIILIITLVNSPAINGVRGLFTLVPTLCVGTHLTLVPMLRVGTEGIAFASEKITPYPPRIKQSPPIEEVKEEKRNTWLWILLGIAVAGGAAAAGGGSSPSSSGGGDGGGGGDGQIEVIY